MGRDLPVNFFVLWLPACPQTFPFLGFSPFAPISPHIYRRVGPHLRSSFLACALNLIYPPDDESNTNHARTLAFSRYCPQNMHTSRFTFVPLFLPAILGTPARRSSSGYFMSRPKESES